MYLNIKNKFLKKLKYSNSKKAFSLIELSIVLMLISIIVSGALVVSTASVNNIKINKNNQKFQEIYKALGTFLLINKRLPCPSSITKNFLTDNDYGQEVIGCSGSGVYQSNNSSNIVYGAIPIKSLGLNSDFAKDEFLSKIAYVVDKRFTIANEIQVNFNNLTFATTPSSNNIIIKNKLFTGDSIVTSDAIIVLISYGINKSGAFNLDDGSQINRSTDISEMENDISNAINSNPSTANFDNVFINNSQTSYIFDDNIFYKSKKNFVDDFKAHHLTACYDAGLFFSNKSAFYNQIIYANQGCWYPEERKRLTRKCLENGNWQEYSQCSFCTISNFTGLNSVNVAIGSGNLSCNQLGYVGTISYQCNIDGSYLIIGNCS